jgi:hypothetical protein
VTEVDIRGGVVDMLRKWADEIEKGEAEVVKIEQRVDSGYHESPRMGQKFFYRKNPLMITLHLNVDVFNTEADEAALKALLPEDSGPKMPTFEVVVDHNDPTKIVLGFDREEWNSELDLLMFGESLQPVVAKYIHEQLTPYMLDMIRQAIWAEIDRNLGRFSLYQHLMTKKWIYRYTKERGGT